MKKMKVYIIIETFNYGYPSIVTDSEGTPLIFDSIEEAEKEASECQRGVVVMI